MFDSRFQIAFVMAAVAAVIAEAGPGSFPEPLQFDSRPSMTTHGDEVLAVAYSPDGGVLATGCADNAVRLWDPATAKLLATFAGHTDAVAALAFSRDGRKLASASYDKTVRIWD